MSTTTSATCVPAQASLDEAVAPRLDAIIQGIRSGSPTAQTELRQLLSGGLRWFLDRSPAVADAGVQLSRILNSAIERIQAGEIGTHEELRRSIRVAAREALGPAQACNSDRGSLDRVESMKTALSELTPLEREAMMRFYRGEAPAVICTALGLTPDDLIKVRQKLKDMYRAVQLRPIHSGLQRLAAGLGTNPV